MLHRRRRSWNLTHSGQQAEQGKPIALPLGRTVARPTDGAAGTGCWRKRRRGCNGVDTGSEFARRENEQTSSRCLVTRKPDQQLSYGKADDGRLSCWCAHKRKRLVAPGRYREVSAGMCWRVSLSRSAFEMLERYAMKIARTVLRGGSGSNATPLPDHQTAGTRRVFWSLF
jgi:hypothetical protein